MPEKDIVEKKLEEYNDIFADIVNVLLFNGRKTVLENGLEASSMTAQYKADGKVHEMERDVAKFWKQCNVRIAFYGLENQTRTDSDMPLRIIGYDGTAYRAQLLDDTKKEANDALGAPETEIEKNSEADETQENQNKQRYPVISLVLYFGYKHHWRNHKSLSDTITVPDELKPYFNDYKINLFEIAWLSDEQVQMFESDFKLVADYFVQMRKNNDYNPPATTIRHVHELLQFMTVMTGDNRFEEACNDTEKGEIKNMCEAFDRAENRGMERGLEIGTERGVDLVCHLMNLGKYDEIELIKKDKSYVKVLLDKYFPNNSDTLVE